ncbi:MAG TPA: hypothetical protein PKX93_01840 [bacterium]|nr:hypothetical protein [bacterium]HOL66184.1 hypothetical protein [bacterium]HPP13297.1 hypothetical protein [bacterium]
MKQRFPAVAVTTRVLLFLFFSLAGQLHPWFVATHVRLTAAAVTMVANTLPEFFRQGEKMIAQTSQDPDFLTDIHGPALVVKEKPDHYFDSEYLQGAELPKTRYEYYRLLKRKNLDPQVVGSLPYAILEWTEKLTGAFAQYRKWPTSREVQTKCLLYAGILAHYVQDLAMPLHVTIHYDGWSQDGVSPRIGLHQKMDGLIQLTNLEVEKIAAGLKVNTPADLFTLITGAIKESHRLVPEVYRLQKQLLAEQKTEPVMRLARQCCQNALSLTATVFLTAWDGSARVVLPDWLQP